MGALNNDTFLRPKKNLSVSDFLLNLLNYMLPKSFFTGLRDFRKKSTKHAFFGNLAFHNHVYFIYN